MENATTEPVLTLETAMTRVRAAGWGGLAFWTWGENNFMACLIRRNGEPDHSTNLWDWQPTMGDALKKIVARAERDPQ